MKSKKKYSRKKETISDIFYLIFTVLNLIFLHEVGHIFASYIQGGKLLNASIDEQGVSVQLTLQNELVAIMGSLFGISFAFLFLYFGFKLNNLGIKLGAIFWLLAEFLYISLSSLSQFYSYYSWGDFSFLPNRIAFYTGIIFLLLSIILLYLLIENEKILNGVKRWIK